MVSLEYLFFPQACKCHLNLLGDLRGPPRICLPTHCPVPLKIQQPPGDSGYRVWGEGLPKFTGAADTRQSSEVILQCVETTLGLGLQSICPFLTSSAALLPP